MRITRLDIRACRIESEAATGDLLRGAKRAAGMEFLVYTMETDSGLRASMFGFAGASAVGSAYLAASLKPFFEGRDARDREALWHDFRTQDRFWSHLPIYIYGPLDACLWLLAAQAAEQPLYKYLGAARDRVPTYLSSMFHDDAAPYVAEALAAQKGGFAGYKLHPPGKSLEEDLDIHAQVREAVGPDFMLASDPVAFMSLPEALRYGRRLEELGFAWFEEPMADESVPALRELTAKLDIPVWGTEVLAKHPYSIAECISTRVVDVVRADVSWSGGVTSVLKTAHLAEAFNVKCEIHTAVLHPLEMVNLHLCAAIQNCSFFELLCPVEDFSFGLTEPLPIVDGVAMLPDTPGLGRDLDWDLIDDTTILKLGVP
ncbi:MAG: enolase C-terminal domain-like protein [Pseudomonadota bacterium]